MSDRRDKPFFFPLEDLDHVRFQGTINLDLKAKMILPF
jgi:hypothetical protein